jgi:hypothetical protein
MAKLFGRLLSAGMALAVTSAALPVSAADADPGSDWTQIEAQVIRYFIPDPANGSGSASTPAGDPASAGTIGDPANDPEWSLAGSEKVRYFVPDGQEEEQLLDQYRESQTVKFSTTHEPDASRQAKKGPGYEPTKSNWRPQKADKKIQGRYVVRINTYRVPQYQDVEYPNRTVDHYKKQTRIVSRYAITSRAKPQGTSAEVFGGDLGSTRVELRQGPWQDVGAVPDPSLSKVVATGFDRPVQELLGYKTYELEEGKSPISAASLDENSKAGAADGLVYSTGGSRGGLAASSAAGRELEISGSSRIAAAGGAKNVDLKDLLALGDVFFGSKGNKRLFRFEVAAAGEGKVLAIFPLNAAGKHDPRTGAAWALNAKNQASASQVTGSGVSGAISGVHGSGSNLKLLGIFQNKLTGDTANNLDLSAGGID